MLLQLLLIVCPLSTGLMSLFTQVLQEGVV